MKRRRGGVAFVALAVAAHFATRSDRRRARDIERLRYRLATCPGCDVPLDGGPHESWCGR